MKLTSSITIGAHTYQTTQYTPTKALKILTLLGKVIGGPLGQVAASGGKGLLDLKLNDGGGQMIAKAVESMFQNLDEGKIDQYVKDILADTTFSGSQRVVDVFDTHFQGRLDELFQLLKWILGVNFGDFFKGLIAKGAAANAQR